MCSTEASLKPVEPSKNSLRLWKMLQTLTSVFNVSMGQTLIFIRHKHKHDICWDTLSGDTIAIGRVLGSVLFPKLRIWTELAL